MDFSIDSYIAQIEKSAAERRIQKGKSASKSSAINLYRTIVKVAYWRDQKKNWYLDIRQHSGGDEMIEPSIRGVLLNYEEWVALKVTCIQVNDLFEGYYFFQRPDYYTWQPKFLQSIEITPNYKLNLYLTSRLHTDYVEIVKMKHGKRHRRLTSVIVPFPCYRWLCRGHSAEIESKFATLLERTVAKTRS